MLLSGQKGPAYYLVPVMGDIATEEQELRQAMARASLRQTWRYAEKYPISDEEIEQEIDAVRTARVAREKKRKG